MRKSALILFILLVGISFVTLAIAQKMSVTTALDFSQVGTGSLLLRDKADRVYSAVIRSYEGFQEFKKSYPIKFDLSKEDFKDSFYIVGFSNNHWGIAADGFKRQQQSSFYYLDIADTGLDIDIDAPPVGKKYTAYVIIRISDAVADRQKIGHVQLREGVSSGVTKWF
jgi:hypothetical protein